jgi:hypothetical protein
VQLIHTELPYILNSRSLPVLTSLLQSSDLAVRKAAGEAAATLYKAAPDCTDVGNDNGETLVGVVETDE